MSPFYRSLLLSISMILFLGSAFFLVVQERSVSDLQEEISLPELFSLCGFRQEGNQYFLEAKCVLQEKLPPLSTQEIIDLLREDIIGFDNEYQPFISEFSYF